MWETQLKGDVGDGFFWSFAAVVITKNANRNIIA
jgi:hypothetical protein